MTLDEFMAEGGLNTFSLRYWSPEVGASFRLDDEGTAEPSLQVVYKRSFRGDGIKMADENFWLYFSPEDAVAIGTALLAWGKANASND